jgi:hypothetical protein
MTEILNYRLSEPGAKLVLEALTELEAKWAKQAETPEGAEEIGNDLVALRTFLEGFRRAAVGTFGLHVTNFSRQPL